MRLLILIAIFFVSSIKAAGTEEIKYDLLMAQTQFTEDCRTCTSTDSPKSREIQIQQLAQQAQKLIEQKQPDRAIVILKQALELQPQGLNLDVILGLLGNAHYSLEEWQIAAEYYQKVAAGDPGGEFTIAALLNLVRTYQSQADWAKEQQNSFDDLIYGYDSLYQESRDLAFKNLKALESLDLDFLAQLQVEVLKTELLPQRSLNVSALVLQLDRLEPNLEKFKVSLHLGQNLENLELLQVAVETAEILNAPQAIAAAKLAQADLLPPEEALNLAYEVLAYCSDRLTYAEICFSGSSRVATLLYRIGQTSSSLEYFQRANSYLSTLNPQYFPYQEAENFYYEWIELHLEQGEVDSALRVFALLQQSQIQQFLEDRCLLDRFEVYDALQPTGQEMLITTIVNRDKTHVILKTASQTVHHQIEIERTQVESLTSKWRQQLTDLYSQQYRATAISLYEVLISPIESELTTIEPSVLVFNHDNRFRGVPMAALFDGSQYLIEKYPIANIVSTSVNNKLASPEKVSLFALSEAPQLAQTLPYAVKEVEAIAPQFKDNRLFLNQEFTRQKLLNSLEQNFDVLHVATHSSFNRTIRDSYLQTYDQKVSFEEIQTQLKQQAFQLDLLVLSACETAADTEISALGIAGFAQQAGAESVLASLWQAEDLASAQLMNDFYHFWMGQNHSKAIALQQAQIAQIRSGTTVSAWSNFVLIGNWN